MTYHRLYLTLHSDHALVQREAIALARYLNIPWKALRNQLHTWNNPKQMRHDTAMASLVRLPDPSVSHQVGIYVLADAFQPDSLRRPLETSFLAQRLYRRLIDGHASPVPPSSIAPLYLADHGIRTMQQATRQALLARGYPVVHAHLALCFHTQLSFLVYSVDAKEAYIHRGYQQHSSWPSFPITLSEAA